MVSYPVVDRPFPDILLRVYTMHKTSVTDCVVIRSRDRDVKSASTSNFRVTFGRPLTGTYMLVYALIPANAYPVTKANNSST